MITNVIGLMSGSSLDGIDMVDVDFYHDDRWHFEIKAFDNISYDEQWKETLSQGFYYGKERLAKTDLEYGIMLGEETKHFIERNNLRPDIIASHGHTIFHRPDLGYTLQIGSGQAIADICNCITINDFRSEDVEKGGQGAPLVPMGDKLLFSEYALCLNIGGIANISYDNNEGIRIAYDICIANQALNYLSRQKGLNYDECGFMARKGNINIELLNSLNDNDYYKNKNPKSLGREFFESVTLPIFNDYNISTEDKLATFVEHIAIQTGEAAKGCDKGKMLISGGGAKNTFLVERIKKNTGHEVIIPAENIIDYKEALVFAFLGLLRKESKINILSSVTGAKSDSSSGKIWFPK
mgnify:CR=1 FL=1